MVELTLQERYKVRMRALSAGLAVAMLMALAAPASASEKQRLTVHTKRLSERQVALHGRAPSWSSMTVVLKSTRGKVLAEIGFDSGRGRYKGFFSAPRSAFRIIVTAEFGDELLRRTRRVSAAAH